MFKVRVKQAFAVFTAGAAAGTIGDYAHFSQGIDGYPPGGLRVPGLGLPFWVPLLFGGATVLIASAHLLVLDRRFFGEGAPAGTSVPRARRLSTMVLGGSVVPFLALYLLSAFVPPSAGGLKDLALFLGALAMWWAFDLTWTGAALALLTAICGTAAEAGLVSQGVFYYLSPSVSFAGVPSWLPWLYAGASSTVGCLTVLVYSPSEDIPRPSALLG